ncbi:MAG TPA: Fe-S cluster assembly protein SufD [Rhabdochlamydiaceae bacterium]|nr:Fe-S cluster assembly protein SufD [Rhabdochlamydiaceae bacterium]
MSIESLQKCFEESCSADLLKGMREKAWDHFLELGLPDKTDEAFRYVPLKRLYDLNLECHGPALPTRAEILESIYPECRESYLVFINGTFIPELSDLTALPKKVVVLPIVDAMRSYGPFLQGRWSKILKEELDPFAVLNLAIHPKGVFFYVPPKTSIQTPIQALYLSQGDLSVCRTHLFLASQSEVEWVSTVKGSGVHNTMLDVVLEDGAQCKHLDVSSEGEGWHLNYLRGSLKRDSRLHHLGVTRGSRITRHSLRATLLGENSDALLQGIWQLGNKSQIHNHVEVQHAAPHAKSLQKFKGILSDYAQSSFEGKIYVKPVAQKTEAYQLNNNLLLSDFAIAYAKPNLEIFADDVKASHGATVSQLDEDELFYLKSRGIDELSAKKLLIEGFINEMTSQITIPSVREAAHV